MKFFRGNLSLAFISVVLIFWTCTREFYLSDDMNYISEIFSLRDKYDSVARSTSYFYMLADDFGRLLYLNQFETYRIILLINSSLFLSVLYRLLNIATCSGWSYGSIFSSIISTLYLSPYLLIQVRSGIAASLSVHCVISLLAAPQSSLLKLFFPCVLLLLSACIHLSSLPFAATFIFFVVCRYYFNIPSLNFKIFISLLRGICKYILCLSPLFFLLGYLISNYLLYYYSSLVFQLSTFSPLQEQIFSWGSFLILLLCACLVDSLFRNTKVFASSSVNFILPSLLIFSISVIGGSSYSFPLQQRFLMPYALLLTPLAISQIFDKHRSITRGFLLSIMVILIAVISLRRLQLVFL